MTFLVHLTTILLRSLQDLIHRLAVLPEPIAPRWGAKGSYHHPLMIRGKPEELCTQMRRVKVKEVCTSSTAATAGVTPETAQARRQNGQLVPPLVQSSTTNSGTTTAHGGGHNSMQSSSLLWGCSLQQPETIEQASWNDGSNHTHFPLLDLPHQSRNYPRYSRRPVVEDSCCQHAASEDEEDLGELDFATEASKYLAVDDAARRQLNDPNKQEENLLDSFGKVEGEESDNSVE
jgi:hypothetical protein